MLALCALLACAATPVLAADAPVELRIGAGLDDQSTPLLYADHAGLFEKAGLHVEIVHLNGGGAAIAAAVAGGSLDIGKANTLEVIAAHARGIPFTIVAPAAYSTVASPEAAIIVPLDSPIHAARDLVGKTLGVTGLVTPQVLATKAWLDANGGDSQSVHFVEIPPPAVPAALEAGRIDAAPIFEPTLTQALAGGKIRAIAYPYGAIAKRFEDADFFTTTAWAAQHGDAIVRFARVMHDANLYVAAHESEMIPLIAAYVKIDPAVLAAMHHPGRALYVTPSELQPLIDAAAKYGFIAAPFPAQELVSDLALKGPK